ncbi:MAG: amidohydrolase family protein [Proteobacteria bacterium]|nr:amidohydrolase family protein [Pseudomonadota bacterium]
MGGAWRRGAGAAAAAAVVLLLGSTLACAAQPAGAGEEGIGAIEGGTVRPPQPAPPRRAGEGEGPFRRLVIRGATLIDGTGAPPLGPVDIVIENDRIARVASVGYPKVPIQPRARPAPGEREIDASGMYVLPGFINAHAHIAMAEQGKVGEVPPAEYVYKLWLGHGITTVREAGSFNGLKWTLEERRRSAAHEIVAPRIAAYAGFPVGVEVEGAVRTPEEARRWVDSIAAAGADGIKFVGSPPDVMQAALAEAKLRHLRSACHHAQLAVARMNVMDTSGWGLTSMEHWYGLPEALFTDRRVQNYPAGYNYNDESDRFGQAGRLWEQAAPRGSERWREVITTLVQRDFTIVPTFTIYEASRDLMREARAEWHDEYTLPTLMRWFAPNREAHGAYWFGWTTADEVAWRRNYAIWMSFINDFKNAGGRVAVGDDAGFIYKLFGFAWVRELELLQEAGFHPLEVVRSATLSGAELLGMADRLGSVEAGKVADLVIVPENPLADFKVLYGTGALRLDDATGKPIRVGGVRYTIHDGIVYDAPALLADVRRMVAQAKQREAAAAR